LLKTNNLEAKFKFHITCRLFTPGADAYRIEILEYAGCRFLK